MQAREEHSQRPADRAKPGRLLMPRRLPLRRPPPGCAAACPVQAEDPASWIDPSGVPQEASSGCVPRTAAASLLPACLTPAC